MRHVVVIVVVVVVVVVTVVNVVVVVSISVVFSVSLLGPDDPFHAESGGTMTPPPTSFRRFAVRSVLRAAEWTLIGLSISIRPV